MNKKRRQWHAIGPGGGGAMFWPTVNPHDGANVISVCDMTGAYISYDAGESWRQFNLTSGVGAVAFSPQDENTIYAGSSGLYRSEDKGRSWRLVFPDPARVTGEEFLNDEAGHRFLYADNWPGGYVQAIALDPDEPAGLHICVNRRHGDGLLAVYSSGDRGRTWAESAVLKGKRIHRLAVDPSSPVGSRSVWAFTDEAVLRIAPASRAAETVPLPEGACAVANAGWGVDPATGRPVFFLIAESRWQGRQFHSGVYRSTDLGQSWAELSGGLSADLHGPDNGQSRRFRNVAAMQADAGTVWIDVWREPMEFFENPRPEMNYCGIMKSTDMGQSWQWVLKMGATYPENLEGGWLERSYSTDWYGGPLGMTAGPADPDVCWLAGYMGVYRTLDGGKSWQQVNSREHADGTSSTRGIDVTTCYGVHFDPFDEDHIAISYTDIGMQHSRDGGSTWRHNLIGVPRGWINTCYWLAFDPEVPGRVWSVWAYAHDLPRFKMFRTRYFEKSPGGVCRSDDGMETWKPVLGGAIPEHCSPVHIVLDPKSPAGSRTLYVAVFGRGVCKSTDDGGTWAFMNNGFGENLYAWRLLQLPDGTLYALMFSGFRDGQILSGQIFRSTDGAASWQEVGMPENANAPADLQFDPSCPKRMYLACWPRSGADRGPRGGVFRTEDGGMSWQRIFAADAYAYALAVHPEKTDTVFLASFDGSVRRSDDRGQTWRRLRGYSFKWAHRPIVDQHDPEMLYVTTFGSSVWHGPAAGDADAAADFERDWAGAHG